MAVSDLSMSDNEPRSSYSNPPSRPADVGARGGGAKPNAAATRRTLQTTTTETTTTKPKMGWGKRLRNRLFGGRSKNRRETMEKASSSSRLFARRPRQTSQAHSRSMSASAFTHSNPPLYEVSAEPQSYGGTPSTPFEHGQKPTAFHGSYFNSDQFPGPTTTTTSTISMSARDFRQPMNSYAYTHEDEAYTNLANQQIDEDLEVSYFNP